MLDIMYTIPSMKNVSECVINRAVVEEGKDPLLLFKPEAKSSEALGPQPARKTMSDAIVFEKSSPETVILPVMSLREVVMFPEIHCSAFRGSGESPSRPSRWPWTRPTRRFFWSCRRTRPRAPEEDGLYEIGTISKVLQMLRLPDGTIKVLRLDPGGLGSEQGPHVFG